MAITSKPLSIANVVNGKSPFTHYAWAWNSLGTDRFTLDYPKENLLHNTKDPAMIVGNNTTNQGFYPYGLTFGYLKNIPAKVNDPVTIVFDWEVTGTTVGGVFYPQFGNTPYNIPNRIGVTVSSTNKSGTYRIQSFVASNWLTDTALAVSVGFRADNLQGTLKITNMRLLLSDKDTGYYPAPADDPTNAYPLYQGVYTDNTATGSTNPQKYTWQRIKGNDGANGQDGVAGKDGVGLSSTNITYAQSTSGTVPPTTGWNAQVPTLIKGQYLWTRTIWTYTDASTETGYTVSYNAKDGNNGTDGIAGKDGVGISSTIVEYVASASGTVKPTAGWSEPSSEYYVKAHVRRA